MAQAKASALKMAQAKASALRMAQAKASALRMLQQQRLEAAAKPKTRLLAHIRVFPTGSICPPQEGCVYR